MGLKLLEKVKTFLNIWYHILTNNTIQLLRATISVQILRFIEAIPSSEGATFDKGGKIVPDQLSLSFIE